MSELEPFRAEVGDWLEAHCKVGTKTLDFACGSGENGIYAASVGSDVVGIDISPEGVENSRANAERFGVEKHCKFEVMDGENMSFKTDTFDFAVEYGALHHVDLEAALSELARVLRPGGKMMCVADIYDALTASDRPYRKAMPHARACEILREEAERGALDADLVELFIREGAWEIEERRPAEPLESVA